MGSGSDVLCAAHGREAVRHVGFFIDWWLTDASVRSAVLSTKRLLVAGVATALLRIAPHLGISE